MLKKHRISLTLCLIFIGLLFSSQARGFIEREYTIHEVSDACTNIVFGKIRSVNAKRLRSIVAVEEDAKGVSNVDEIKMNFATGQYRRGSSPPQMVKLLKVGMPIIVFYQRNQWGIQSLSYIDGMWFQTYGPGEDFPDGWWSFPHTDPYLLRTFDGSTMEFQKIVRAILAGEKWPAAPKDAVKVLVLTGNSTKPMYSQVPVETNTVGYEYNAIRKVKRADDKPLAYESTQDRSLSDLDEADILWPGHGEIAYGGYLLNKEIEEKIKTFVANGGIVIVSGQDSDQKRPCEIGWLVGSLTGVERPPTQDFKITDQREKLFAAPHLIEPGEIYIDDAWTDWDQDFEVFATTNDGKHLVVGVRKHSRGLYIFTSLRNDGQETVKANEKLMENILHYAAHWSPE